jgi:hypothetical protein
VIKSRPSILDWTVGCNSGGRGGTTGGGMPPGGRELADDNKNGLPSRVWLILGIKMEMGTSVVLPDGF